MPAVAELLAQLGGAIVILSNQPHVVIGIVENHEYGHLQDKLELLNRRGAAAEELERRTFPNRAACMFECNKFKIQTDIEAVRGALWGDILKEFGWY